MQQMEQVFVEGRLHCRIAQPVEWICAVDDLFPMQDYGIIGMRVKVSVLEDLYVRVHSISDVGDGDDHTSKAEEPVIRILGMCQIRIPNLIDVHPELAHLTAWSSTYPAFSFMPDILVPLCCCRPLCPR